MQKKTRLSLFKANTFFWQTLAGLIVAMTLSGFLVFAVAWGFLNPDHTLLLNHPGEDRVIFAEEVVSLGGKPALTSWLQNQHPGPDHARVYAVDSTDHDLGGHKIPNMIISNNGKQLVFEGFPQNPKGKRGTYIVKNSNKLDIYNDITNSKIPFESLEEGDNIVIYYQDRVQTSKIRTGDMDELLSLTDNQKISDVKSITVFEPPLRHSVIPQE